MIQIVNRPVRRDILLPLPSTGAEAVVLGLWSGGWIVALSTLRNASRRVCRVSLLRAV